MSFIVSISHKVLFLVPSHSIRTIGPQVKAFEFAIRGIDFIENFEREYLEQIRKQKELTNEQKPQNSEPVNLGFGNPSSTYEKLVNEGK